MTRPKIIEISDDEARVRYTERFFQRVANEQNIGPNYDGKYVCFVAIATNIELDETQLGGLQDEIDAINGVFKSFALIGSSRIPYDRLPADTADLTFKLSFGVQGGFEMRGEAVEEPVP